MLQTTIILLLFGSAYTQPSRIVGGVDTDITKFPYQVSLQYTDGFNFCGGSILSEKWILTAGHCMETDPNPTNKQVVVGMTKLSEGGVIHSIKQSIRHFYYGSRHTYSHDMALIELNNPIQFNERAQTIKLPRDDQPVPVDGVCTIQGWGLLSEEGDRPDVLQSTSLLIWEPYECAKVYFLADTLFEGPEAPMMCAGWPDSHTDTCYGDSGSALAYNGVQYGIVSFGNGCAKRGYPKIFTNVYNLRHFIYFYTDLKM